MPRRKRSSQDSQVILRRFLTYLIPYRLQFLVILGLILGISGAQLVFPWIIGRIIDRLTQLKGWESLVPLMVVFGVVLCARAGMILGRTYLLQRAAMRVTCDMRISIFRHLQTLSLKFYEERQTGKVVARVTDDTTTLHSMVAGATVNLLGDLVAIIGVIIVLLLDNYRLTLVSIIVLPLFVFNYLWHKRRMRIENRRHRRNWNRVVGFLHERIAATRVVKAFAKEDVEVEQFSVGIESDYSNYGKVVWRNTLLSVGAEILSGFGTLLVLIYGTYMVIHGVNGFTVGRLVAFYTYLGLMYQPILRVVESNATIQQALTALEKIFALLDTSPHIPNNDVLPSIPAAQGVIEFRHVDFEYRIGQTTLRDVNFTTRPSEMIALVGPSGAGKTTIVTLLARFYDPTRGQVLIDGKDITQFNVQSLRRQIGIVMQDNILFAGTVRDNIKYGRPEATDHDMIEAAKAANAHEFILKFRNGYDSVIGERGVSLSGGQRQRLAIARVILKDPRILIFDEATSALDSQSERLIQEATERLMKNRTSFVIAHRLSTIVNANRIFVMRDGSIVQQGSHQDLVDKPGLYQDLHSLQFSSSH